MTTVRRQLSDALAPTLTAATGLTVHRNLDYALEDRNLPVLALMSGRDEASLLTIGMLDHQAQFDIAILIAKSNDPEGAADPYEAQIHAALFASGTLGGHQVLIDRLGGEWDFDLGDCCIRTLTYRIGYRTTFASLES